MGWFRVLPSEHTDRVDAGSPSISTTHLRSYTFEIAWYDQVALILAAISVIIDVVTDCFVCYRYFQHNLFWEFLITLLIVLIPSWITTYVSLKWYILQEQENPHYKVASQYERRWLLVVAHVFQLSLLYRYVNSLIYMKRAQDPKRSEKQRHLYYYMMTWEDSDTSTLRLIEAFMEACPQLILHIVILSTYRNLHPSVRLADYVSLASSFISLTWAIVSYMRTLRLSMAWNGALPMGLTASICSFLWNAFILAPRILIFALAAGVLHVWILVDVGIRFFLNLIWIRCAVPLASRDTWERRTFTLVLSIVYIFVYVDIADGKSRYRYLVFYSLSILDNAALLAAWWFYSNPDGSYRLALPIGSVCSYLLGFGFMALYYGLFHPGLSSKVRLVHHHMGTETGSNDGTGTSRNNDTTIDSSGTGDASSEFSKRKHPPSVTDSPQSSIRSSNGALMLLTDENNSTTLPEYALFEEDNQPPIASSTLRTVLGNNVRCRLPPIVCDPTPLNQRLITMDSRSVGNNVESSFLNGGGSSPIISDRRVLNGGNSMAYGMLYHRLNVPHHQHQGLQSSTSSVSPANSSLSGCSATLQTDDSHDSSRLMTSSSACSTLPMSGGFRMTAV